MVTDSSLSGISSILAVVAVDCFGLLMKGSWHFEEICPGLLHLKQRLLSKHLCHSSGVSFSTQMASMVPFAYRQPSMYSGCAAQPPRKIDRPDIDISGGGRGDLILHYIIL